MKFALHRWGRKRSGSILVEVAVGFALLIAISLMLMKLSMIVLANRSWVVKQTLSDAYCTRELGYAKRIPFDALTADLTTGGVSPWPTGIANASKVNVVMGKLAIVNGVQTNVTGTVTRYKEPMANNLVGGVGSAATNPAAINSFLVQSILTYQINGKTYYKTRSAIRTQ